MNNIIETMINRRSLRKFSDRNISDEELELILKCAMKAPTAGNMMTYSIIVVKNQEMKDKLAVSCDNQPFIAKSDVILIFAADYSKWYKYYKNNNIIEFLEKKNEKFEAPTSASFILAIEDAMCASQNAVIAAESMGIGSCYIGDILENKEYHQEILNLPEFVCPVSMLVMGHYPDDYKKIDVERFDKNYVVFDEVYRKLSDEEIAKMYSDRDTKYVVNNKYGADNYAQMHYSFKVKSDFSKEMERSINVVLDEWNGKEIK